MPIIIPSECIYDKDNSKTRSNVIDNVSVDYTSVTRTNDYEKVVGDYSFQGDNFITENGGINQQTNVNFVTSFGTNYFSSAVVEIRPTYFTKDFSISRTLQNEYIEKLLIGLNKNKDPNIKFSIVGDLEKGGAYVTGYINNYSGDGAATVNSDDIVFSGPPLIQENFRYTLPDLTSFSHEFANYDMAYSPTATATIKFTSEENIADEKIVSIDDDNNVYNISNAKFFVGATLIKLGGKANYAITNSFPLSISLSGTYEKYTPKQIEVTFYGNTLLINISDGSAVYGSGEKPFSLSRNELMQESATTLGYKTTEFLANNILSQYATGKETATILCSISDYYDDNGTLYVSTKNDELPMTFQIGDEVVPMVFGADGKDHYMSMKNGEGKVFSVIGTKVFYDGAVWQELYLQEK